MKSRMSHLSLVENRAVRTDEGCSEPGFGLRVLVVDNHAFTARLQKKVLERAGFRVTLVKDAATAALALRRTSFDLVVGAPGIPRLGNAPWLVTTKTPVSEQQREDAAAIGAAHVAPCGDVVDALLVTIWDR